MGMGKWNYLHISILLLLTDCHKGIFIYIIKNRRAKAKAGPPNPQISRPGKDLKFVNLLKRLAANGL